ncbi:MAG: ATP-binding protein [Fimbriimonas sp.]
MQPTGHFTFLFTDIEGSSRLWELEPQAMSKALALHNALLGEVFAAYDGHVFKTVGDAFCVAFSNSRAATEAALVTQRRLAAAPWPAGSEGPLALKVRIGILSGEAEARDGDYFGPALHRVARLTAIASGGQVVAGEEIAESDGDRWRDLGVHRLRDVPNPIRVYQLTAEGLPDAFPPLRTVERVQTNLPEGTTRLVGREEEAEMCRRLLNETRVLTLTGPGGVGKTRLALHLAAERVGLVDDGVWFVELATMQTRSQVWEALARVLSARAAAGQSVAEAVIRHFGTDRHLVVLDNCEQMVGEAAHVVTELLRQSRNVQVVITSREALGVDGEQRFRVPSLGLPIGKGDPAAASTAAVRLFVQRAAAVQPSFRLTPENTPTVAELCRRLDGIPLALELAAARLRSLPISAIFERLDRRFQLLTGGSRTAEPRQQTLRGAIEWSYDLLDEPERRLFQRLAIFADGWTLDACLQVAGGEEDEFETVDLLTSLVEKSLVVFGEDQRYLYLESIRQFAEERLEEAERNALEARRLAYFEARSEGWKGSLTTDVKQAMPEVGREYSNIVAAVAFAARAPESSAAGIRLISNILRYWQVTGQPDSALALFESLMAANPTDARALAQASMAMGVMYFSRADSDRCIAALARAAELYRDLGDRRAQYGATVRLATAYFGADALNEARELANEVLEIGEREGYAELLPSAATLLSQVCYRNGDFDGAYRYSERARAQFDGLGNRHGMGVCTNNMAHAARRQGRLTVAADDYREALAIRTEIADLPGVMLVVEGLAKLALAMGRTESGCRLAGVGEFLRDHTGIKPIAYEVQEWAETIGGLRYAAGDRFEAWMASGPRSAEAVAAFAQAEVDRLQSPVLAM